MSGLAVKVRFQPKDVSKIPKKMRKELLAKRRLALLKTAQVGVSIITDRTAKGDGYKGAFEPYKKSYAIWKTKPVNQGGGGHTSTMPNLNLTGFIFDGFILAIRLTCAWLLAENKLKMYLSIKTLRTTLPVMTSNLSSALSQLWLHLEAPNILSHLAG